MSGYKEFNLNQEIQAKSTNVLETKSNDLDINKQVLNEKLNSISAFEIHQIVT